jgi:hypothetical protein
MAFIEEEGREIGESVIADNAEPWSYSSSWSAMFWDQRIGRDLHHGRQASTRGSASVITPVSLRAHATQTLICAEDFEV